MFKPCSHMLSAGFFYGKTFSISNFINADYYCVIMKMENSNNLFLIFSILF